jgi:sensor histidine kinase YesM
MVNINRGNIGKQLPVISEDETGQLTKSFNTMTKIINDLIFTEYENTIKLRTMQLRQKEAQFQYLRGQINPHFLYNTLDNIRIKAALNNDGEVAEMIMLLVEFFRGNMDVINSSTIPMAVELKQIRIYFKLMRCRYPLLEAEFDTDEELDQIKIPSFILQPLVENSLLHGLKSVNYRGKIRISSARDPEKRETILIKIADNGAGLSGSVRNEIDEVLHSKEEQNPMGNRYIGISNVQRRLRMFYPDGYGLFFEDNPGGGVVALIKIRE